MNAAQPPVDQPDVLTGGPIVVGGTAEDTFNGLNVRSTPGGSTIVGTVDAAVRGSVIGGPEVAELDGTNYTWWDVQWPSLSGWSASGFLENVYSTLSPENVSPIPTSATAGSSVVVDFTIRNIGNGASLATTANIVLSTSSTAPSGSDPVLGSVNVNALSDDDGEQSFSPSVTIPADTNPGQFYLWIVPDPGGTANQGPNAGDTASAPFAVTFPITFNDGILSVVGTNASDTVSVTDNAGSVTATVNGISNGPYTSVSGISVVAGGGDDSITLLSVPIATTITATGGTATIVGGDGGNSVRAHGIDNFLTGGAGNDTLVGPGAYDTIFASGSGDDFLKCKNDDNKLRGGTGGDDTLMGGSGDDTLKGHGGNNSIVAGSGNDMIHARAGNNTIVGGAGQDTITGNAANNTITAGAGGGEIIADVGEDSITGSTTAGDQPDSIYCGSATDTILAGDGDQIFDTVAGDQISGGTIVS
ncbi:MAG TPA: hypothetical protein VMD30_02000 [Tepidisphaeraceae bacterium]|nr:hypothetical protein [Tepidisphaeraceae bacterium]